MKLPLSIKIVSGALLLALTAAVLLLVIQPDKDDLATMDSEDTNGAVTSVAQNAFEFESIEHYIGFADHIVYGQVTDVAPFEPGSSEYTFQITHELKGSTENDIIHVYNQNNTMEPGVDYLLFLQTYRGGLYPHTVYKVLRDGGLVRMDKERVTHSNALISQDVKPKDLLADIAASPALSQYREVDALESAMIIPDYLELKDLAKQADLVAIIEPVEIMKKNKYMAFATVKLTQQLQGDITISAEDLVCLPAKIETGRQYVVFLQIKEGIPIVASKQGSLFEASDKEKWNEAMQAVER
ncbi:hypothetical protein PA598K_00825 [Paenibacillus sp. 598K]|uniref:hypothetical protein n=1 Tax=Paenibacillus sp. 598K TaxID=1117987 RepID=UPI000FFAAE34|nr:hypothetical protein [Paenibacillus sp. 598K]GBF72568.1 hypothetical protein PA598K_00825 [Paenibacillus sp. 598K]